MCVCVCVGDHCDRAHARKPYQCVFDRLYSHFERGRRRRCALLSRPYPTCLQPARLDHALARKQSTKTRAGQCCRCLGRVCALPLAGFARCTRRTKRGKRHERLLGEFRCRHSRDRGKLCVVIVQLCASMADEQPHRARARRQRSIQQHKLPQLRNRCAQRNAEAVVQNYPAAKRFYLQVDVVRTIFQTNALLLRWLRRLV